MMLARPAGVTRRSFDVLRRFFGHDAAGGAVLLTTTVAALVWANVGSSYAAVRTHVVGGHTVVSWVNDWLMTPFFFVIGLEIKRELVSGELAGLRRALLPAIAAAGGMLAPALIYLAFTVHTPEARGWGIPVATDIAFVVGCLSLLGGRVPRALAVFIVALAVFDDIGGIAVIAVGYGGGVHVTIFGVAAAMLVPRRWLGAWTARLHPWSAFLVVPVFALVNAGLDLRHGQALLTPVTLGVALGLFVGKQLGIMAATTMAVKARLAPLPSGTTWSQLHGVSVLAGIGFTVSLFITEIAQLPAAEIGILAGSLASGVVGYVLLAR
jgi:NhaA family Na+:H+ antiporter